MPEFLDSILINLFFNCRKKVVRSVRKLNPLKNTRALLKLNPYAAVLRRKAIIAQLKRKEERAALLRKKLGVSIFISYILDHLHILK